jgi:hypothetical protein
MALMAVQEPGRDGDRRAARNGQIADTIVDGGLAREGVDGGIKSQRLVDEGGGEWQKLRLGRRVDTLGAELTPDSLLMVREERQQERDPEQGDGGRFKARRHHCAHLIDDYLRLEGATAALVTRRAEQIE